MGLERAFLWFAELVMLAALLCFVQGFRVRESDRALHMRLGKLGALLVFAGLVAVEVLQRGLHWQFPIRSPELLRVHILVASGALLVLVVLVATGLSLRGGGPTVARTRRRALHVKLYLLFFPLYVATIVLSFCAFRLW